MLRFQSEIQTRGWADFQKGFELFSGGSDAMRRIQFVLNGIFVHASNCTDARQLFEAGEAMQENLLSALDAVLISPEAISQALAHSSVTESLSRE